MSQTFSILREADSLVYSQVKTAIDEEWEHSPAIVVVSVDV
jgi:hypothetical protein